MIDYNKRCNDVSTLIVFYDLYTAQLKIKEIFLYFENWMLNNGFEPKRAFIDSDQYKTDKTKSFNFIKKKILSLEPSSIHSFSISAYPPTWDIDMLDSIASINININKPNLLSVYFLNNLLEMNKVELRKFILELIEKIPCAYAIILPKEQSKGPSLYAYGAVMGVDYNDPNSKIYISKISNWRRAYQTNNGTYKTGMLRDIYPMNFISKIHLDQPVYGGSLQQWIESSSLHGELEKFNENLWLWTVPEDKTESIANDLKDTGLIVSLRD